MSLLKSLDDLQIYATGYLLFRYLIPWIHPNCLIHNRLFCDTYDWQIYATGYLLFRYLIPWIHPNCLIHNRLFCDTCMICFGHTNNSRDFMESINHTPQCCFTDSASVLWHDFIISYWMQGAIWYCMFLSIPINIYVCLFCFVFQTRASYFYITYVNK